ncbi:MAG: hypothetical protein Q8R15_03145 [Candidatus Micrarchaeota archaeon]|nr:hypothetical protein [Candidatus Micrarchaeota archaeon]
MELVKPGKIRQRGSIKFFKTPAGSHVIVLPTCSVPHESLIPENWHDAQDVGHMRRVTSVTGLKELGKPGKHLQILDLAGKPTTLYVKSPERLFHSFGELHHGNPWLAYPDSKVLAAKLPEGDIRVEKQAVWEARILLGLVQGGVKAEEPQAILVHADGTREVVTKKVNRNVDYPLNPSRIREQLRSRPFRAIDAGEHNLIPTEHGTQIIDVNRWEFPPFSDTYKKRLIEAVLEEVEKQKKK